MVSLYRIMILKLVLRLDTQVSAFKCFSQKRSTRSQRQVNFWLTVYISNLMFLLMSLLNCLIVVLVMSLHHAITE